MRVRLRLFLGRSSKSEVPATLLCVEVRFPKTKAAVPLLVGDGVRLEVLLVSDKGVGLRLALRTESSSCMSSSIELRKLGCFSEDVVDESVDDCDSRAFSRVRSRSKVGGMPRSSARAKARVSEGYWLSPMCSRTGVLSRALGSFAASGPLVVGSMSAMWAKCACWC